MALEGVGVAFLTGLSALTPLANRRKIPLRGTVPIGSGMLSWMMAFG